MPPFISILLPSKNPGRFLAERLDSIFAQTLTDWELIIVDSASTDGSLAVFQELARKDPRVALYERPPGLYQAWNFAIRQAQGKYVYVATADDSMVPEALAKMAQALEAHPECGLCDSRLQLIDEEGRTIREFADHFVAHAWHLAYPRDRVHVRKRPADFYAHLGGKTVYTSITQLLIRRSLFEQTGLFPEDQGPDADFLWGMRAALHADVIFLPETLASWRIHPEQATLTAGKWQDRGDFFRLAQMAETALKEAPPEIAAKGRKMQKLAVFKGILLPAKKRHCSAGEKLLLLARALLSKPLLTLEFLLTLPLYRLRIPGRFAFLYAYDRMIRRRAGKFYRDSIVFCDTPAPGTKKA